MLPQTAGSFDNFIKSTVSVCWRSETDRRLRSFYHDTRDSDGIGMSLPNMIYRGHRKEGESKLDRSLLSSRNNSLRGRARIPVGFNRSMVLKSNTASLPICVERERCLRIRNAHANSSNTKIKEAVYPSMAQDHQ